SAFWRIWARRTFWLDPLNFRTISDNTARSASVSRTIYFFRMGASLLSGERGKPQNVDPTPQYNLSFLCDKALGTVNDRPNREIKEDALGFLLNRVGVRSNCVHFIYCQFDPEGPRRCAG